MIEVVSFPANLTTWQPQDQPFYLELYGETSPDLDAKYAEVLPKGGATPSTTESAPVYEYWWTLGHLGGSIYWPGQDDVSKPPRATTAAPWEGLGEKIAAQVFLEFPIEGGWRPREIVATVKYLTPVAQQHAWWNQLGQDLKLLDPELDAASKVAGLVPGGSQASKVLETISKLQVSSVPQTKDFPWSVEKVTAGGNNRPVTQGVMWNLPASLLRAQGGRVTGSVAVSLLPVSQQSALPAVAASSPQCMPIRASASIFPRNGAPFHVPSTSGRRSGNRSIELMIQPKQPSLIVG